MGTSLSFKRERCGGGTPFRVARRSLPVGSSAVPAAGVCQRLTPPQRKGPGRAAADPGEFPAASERDGGRQNYRDASSRPPEGKIRSPHAPPLPRPAAGASRPLRGIPLRPAASSAGSHRGVPASPAHLLPPARRRAACALPGLGQGEYPRPVLSPLRDRPCPPPATGARAGRSPVRRVGGGTASAARRQQPPGGDGRPGRRGPGLPAKPHPAGCPPPVPLAERRSGRREGGGSGAPARRGARR